MSSGKHFHNVLCLSEAKGMDIIMIEIRGDKKVLITPVSAEDLKDIHIGDIVWLDGDLMTCRDVAHRRLVYGLGVQSMPRLSL